MAAVAGRGGTVGVGDLAQISHGLAELGWVEAAGRVDQDRFGVGGEVVGELAGALGQHPGMGRGDLALGQGGGASGQATTEQCPGGPDHLGRRPRPQPEPVAQPSGG
jgi:hypothetical protein